MRTVLAVITAAGLVLGGCTPPSSDIRDSLPTGDDTTDTTGDDTTDTTGDDTTDTGDDMGGWVAMESPVTADLTSIWGVDMNDVWIAGKDGAILRNMDSAGFMAEQTGTDLDFYAVWGSGTQRVFVTGEAGAVFIFDGENWDTADAGTDADLTGICGKSDTDVWAVGSGGEMVHFDGDKWVVDSAVDAGMTDVWMLDDGAGFAVGDNDESGPGMFTMTQDGWAASDVSTVVSAGDRLEDVWGRTADDFWAVGSTAEGGGILLHWDGAIWSRGFDPPSPLIGVWGSGTQNVWMGGPEGLVHKEGDTVTSVTLGASITGVWGSGTQHVWAIGEGGAIFQLGPDTE